MQITYPSDFIIPFLLHPHTYHLCSWASPFQLWLCFCVTHSIVSSDNVGLTPFASPATLKYWLLLSDIFQNWDIVTVHLTSNNKFWEINLLKVVSIPPLKVKWRAGNGAQGQVLTQFVQDLGPIVSIKNTSEVIMSQVAFLDMQILWCGSPGERTGRNELKKRENGAEAEVGLLFILSECSAYPVRRAEAAIPRQNGPDSSTLYWRVTGCRCLTGPHDLERDNSQSRQFRRQVTRKDYVLQLWVMVWAHQQLLLKWLQNVMGKHKMLC